jgi:hypothetical protein
LFHLLFGLMTLSCIQKVDDAIDFLAGQNQVSTEWRHDRQGIALGLVRNDRNQLAAIREPLLHVHQGRTDIAGSVAALYVVTGEAVALAAIVRKLFAL